MVKVAVPARHSIKGRIKNKIFSVVFLSAGAIVLLFFVSLFKNAGEKSTPITTTVINQNTASSDDSGNETNKEKRPFQMPISGNFYKIYQPIYDMNTDIMQQPLLSSPVHFVEVFKERLSWVDTLVTKTAKFQFDIEEQAIYMYLEMIKSFVSATVFNDAELSVRGNLYQRKPRVQQFDLEQRRGGKDWTYVGDTMTGSKRIDNVFDIIQNVVRNNIKGDYMETGVWRGGSSIFAKAVMSVLEPNSKRLQFVCDSFRGLPPGDSNVDAADIGWDNTPYLEVSDKIVANNFAKYGLLDPNIIFVKGFFNETMLPLSKYIGSIAVMRLDGDMYRSTVDVLYNMYDKLSIGGFVIMDDWKGYPSKTACEDFFKAHGIQPEIHEIDSMSAYWKKTEDVEIQYWRYRQSKFKDGDKQE